MGVGLSSTGPRVAVLGGGAAGLLAAHRLRALGCAVTLLEAADRVGGMIRTVRREGYTIDTGAITLAEPEGEVAALLAATGAMACLTAPAPGSSRRYLVHQGRPIPVPTTPAEMIATPLLSVAGRLRMLKEPFVARGGDPEETVAAFARRRFGEEMAARFLDPLVSGTSGGDPERLLAAHAFPRLVAFERRAGSVLKGRMRAAREARRLGRPPAGGTRSAERGLATLTDALANTLGDSVVPDARVTAVRMRGRRVELEIADGRTIEVDGAVVALPATAYGRIDWSLSGADLGPVNGVPHASLATVSIGIRREDVEHPLDGHGVLAPSAEQRRALTVQFVSTQFPDRAPAGHVLLTVVLGGARHAGDVDLPDAALVELARGECEGLVGLRGEPALVEVARWPGAMPMAVAGHGARVAAADLAEEATGRLSFCGAWRDGLAVGDVMQGGVAAADRLAARLDVPGVAAPPSE